MRLYATLIEVFGTRRVAESMFQNDSGKDIKIAEHLKVDCRYEDRKVLGSGRISSSVIEGELKSEVEIPAGTNVVVEIEAKPSGNGVKFTILGIKGQQSALPKKGA